VPGWIDPRIVLMAVPFAPAADVDVVPHSEPISVSGNRWAIDVHWSHHGNRILVVSFAKSTNGCR